jgi:3-hydroxybutyryl-CoA dehydrogenase
MEILVVADNQLQAEFKSKFGVKHSVNFKSSKELEAEDVNAAEAIFDFDMNTSSLHGNLYHQNNGAVLLLNSVKTTLNSLVRNNKWEHTVIGFNGLPGFFNRSRLEITVLEESPMIEQFFQRLETNYRIVGDRVGMVTPRVVSMIINEAFYTVQEGTASEKDIDIAMRLGTNYPAGPFEMLENIGLNHVYELLQAVYQDTGEERYKVCPLLKSRYLLNHK